MENYEILIDRISKASGKTGEEIEEKIDQKRKKFSGFISKEGAAHIVAAELGVSLDGGIVKIKELNDGMRRVNFIGKITKIFPVREFKKADREGKIGSFLIGDETSNVRVVLWDLHHIDLIEKGRIVEGKVVEIFNANVKNGEVHLSGFSDIKESNERVDNAKTIRQFSEGQFVDVKSGKNMKVRAVIVQSFEPRYFDSKDGSGKRALLNIVLDDGTETIRAVLFGEQINKLGLTDEEIFSLEKFNQKKNEFLGEEMIFSGNFRVNNFFNNLEMNIENVEDVDVDKLIEELEAKI